MTQTDSFNSTYLRRNATLIASGVAGASTLALLAAGSALALFAGADATPAVVWLGSLGTNALASWLDQWARANLARAISAAPDTEQQLLERLARDLHGQLAHSSAVATDMATLLERTQAIPNALDALNGQGTAQIGLLRRLLEDVQRSTYRNERLHDVALRAVREQGEVLHDLIARSDAALLAALRALHTGDHVQADKVQGNKLSIGGSVGTMQNVIISGGTVSGPIIGSQTNNYHTPGPVTDRPSDAVTQEDIADQRELLDLHRRTLASYLKRLARVGAAYAPPEIDHGIRDSRMAIQRAKATLRGWGVTLEDLPDDENQT